MVAARIADHQHVDAALAVQRPEQGARERARARDGVVEGVDAAKEEDAADDEADEHREDCEAHDATDRTTPSGPRFPGGRSLACLLEPRPLIRLGVDPTAPQLVVAARCLSDAARPCGGPRLRAESVSVHALLEVADGRRESRQHSR